MASEVTSTLDTTPLVLTGLPVSLERHDATILTDAGRVTALAKYTVLAKVAATGKYVPWDTLTATDGSALPRAILMSDDIAAATIAAGDVTGVHILEGDALVDESKLVFDGGTLSLASVINPSDATNKYWILTGRDVLKMFGIVPNDVDYIQAT
jgi:hypothetical protein